MEPASPGYTLADPRPIAASAPYTFFLPSEAERAAVGPHDLVKLGFDYLHVTEKWAGERVWVIVQTAESDQLRGVLDNDPVEPTSLLKAGDPVLFERHHILDIDWETPDAAPSSPAYRTYWDRCLVDRCVLDGDETVEFLYREEPEPPIEGATYPDSGWRIRGRQGEATDEEMAAREFAYVALGAVLNRDDSWIDWIDAAVGTAIMRDFEKNVYVERSG